MEEKESKEALPRTACGGKLKDPTSFPSTLYRGERVYFCNQACLRTFEKDPDPFMAGDVEHPVNED